MAQSMPAFFASACALLTLATPVLAGESVTLAFTVPSGDRWNYPFNPTPGTRPTASVFGNEPGSPLFDNRDGQMVVYWNTAADIPAGRRLEEYQVQSLRVTLEFASDLSIAFDPTIDPWQSFLPESDPLWIADEDPGQPIELFGTGFRNGFTLESWVETSPFAPAGSNLLMPGVRNAFPLAFVKGAGVDISNHVREEFTPVPFAIGDVPGVEPGALIPVGSACVFEIDLSDPAVLDYVRHGLQAGRVSFTIASMAAVVQQGSVFPAFYCKESPLVQAGFAAAAALEVTLSSGGGCGPADFDCDGTVGPADLAQFLGAWGTTQTQFDLDGDGVVGASDLAILLGQWG